MYSMPWLHTLCVGVSVSTPDGIGIARGVLLECSVDLPARAMVLQMKQFNGAFGCCYCEVEGETEAGNPLHRFWPSSSTMIPRTHESITANACKAVAEKNPVRSFA